MIPPTRVPGAPESYTGRYQTTPGAVSWTAPCEACGQPCTWTASPHHGTATDCGCPPDTGTGASEGEVGAPVPAPSTAPGDNPVDNCASAGDNRPATAGFPLIQARRPVESPAAQGFST